MNHMLTMRPSCPAGPVIISPDGLLPSLYRELVLRRPHEFKIRFVPDLELVTLLRGACCCPDHAACATMGMPSAGLPSAVSTVAAKHPIAHGRWRATYKQQSLPNRCLEDIRALFPPEWQPFYAGFGNRDTDEISYLAVGVPAAKIFIINNRSAPSIVSCWWHAAGSSLRCSAVTWACHSELHLTSAADCATCRLWGKTQHIIIMQRMATQPSVLPPVNARALVQILCTATPHSPRATGELRKVSHGGDANMEVAGLQQHVGSSCQTGSHRLRSPYCTLQASCARRLQWW